MNPVNNRTSWGVNFLLSQSLTQRAKHFSVPKSALLKAVYFTNSNWVSLPQFQVLKKEINLHKPKNIFTIGMTNNLYICLTMFYEEFSHTEKTVDRAGILYVNHTSVSNSPSAFNCSCMYFHSDTQAIPWTLPSFLQATAIHRTSGSCGSTITKAKPQCPFGLIRTGSRRGWPWSKSAG